MTSSGVAWVWMTEVAVAGDELRRGHPQRSPGIADFGDELQRGVRHGRRRTWLRRRARRRERRRRTWLPAMWSPDCRLELQHRRPPSTAPPLTPTSGSIRVAGRYHLIPLKYHLICGRIAWIPGRYQDLIHRKHHPQRGKNRMIPDRISFVKPDDTRHDTDEDHDTSQVSCDSTTYQISDDSYHVSDDTREDSPPFMRPCPTSELAGGRVLHAGARRRQPRPSRRSSAAAAASAPPASASSALLPWGPALSHLREVDWERSRWDSIPTGYRYIAAPK
uniref:Uncharacterized protein n=2 Tax=Oryza sativa subsp. japonica TaxID=39947 RepID=Q53LG9_ORYSJ|nr:hypothetical protein LOC_Os11g09050 [Oryza sativa Japonica Group]ABA91877.1 hypothetical protein LOC_Os11g09050 [Oryza sativa Japonica Group]